MATEPLTQEAGTAFAVHDTAHAFLVIHVEGDGAEDALTQLVEMVEGKFGED